MFNLFKKKTDERGVSFAFGMFNLTTDGTYIMYKSPYGNSFRVLKQDIETVSLDVVDMGSNKVRLIGKGTVLAEVSLPKSWAEKAQEFINKEIRIDEQP